MAHQSDNELSDTMLDALVARERRRIDPPLTQWDALAARLRDEGVIGASGPSVERHAALPGATGMPLRRYGTVVQWGMRIAAGVVLLGAGVVVGRGWTPGGETPVGAIASSVRPGDASNAAQGGAAVTNAASANTTSSDEASANATATDVASTTSVPAEFHSVADARKAMTDAVSTYQRAAAYLTVVGAAKGPRARQPELYQARLAALDQMLSATHEAMEQAPHDPVVKQYYISGMSARQTTLRQLRQSLPQGVQLASY